MGGNNSKQVADAITKSIATNIVKSVQTSSNNYISSQVVSGHCTAEQGQAQIDGMQKCINSLVDRDFSAADIKSVCEPIITCSASDIELSQTVSIMNSGEQKASINSGIKSNTENALSQFASDANSQEINAVTDAITSNRTDITNTIVNDIQNTQVIIAENYRFHAIKLDQAMHSTTRILQSNTAIQSSINKVATTITQVSVKKTTTIAMIGGIVIAVFLLIFAILLLSKSKDLKDFFYKLVPFIVWTILVALITVIHILVKPDYISYTMEKETKKRLDMPKLLMWLFIYYVSTAIIVYVFFKIVRRNDGKEDSELEHIEVPDDDDDDDDEDDDEDDNLITINVKQGGNKNKNKKKKRVKVVRDESKGSSKSKSVLGEDWEDD